MAIVFMPSRSRELSEASDQILLGTEHMTKWSKRAYLAIKQRDASCFNMAAQVGMW